MLERLFKNKKYIFLYFMSLLASFSNMGIIYNPFSSSIFSAMVSEKVPVLVPFVATIVTQWALFGKVALIRFALFSLIFAFLISIRNKKVKSEQVSIKPLILTNVIAYLFSEVFMILAGISEITDIKSIILCALMQLAFFVIFKRAIKYIDSLKAENEEKITTINVLSMIVMIICVTSFLQWITFFGINLWHLLCVLLLMAYCWKNKFIKALLSAIVVILVIGFTSEISLIMALLLIMVSMVSTLISRANRKGAIIGAVVCLMYIALFMGSNISSEDPAKDAVNNDYKNFLKSTIANLEDKSGEEYFKYTQELERLEYEEALKKEARNTNSLAVLKYMLVGFILLIIVPAKLILRFKEKVEIKDDFKFLREKLFKNTKIYRLNAGK